MKFAIVLAMLVAVAVAMPKASNELPESMVQELHDALVQSGVDPEVANGWLSNAWGWVTRNAGTIARVATTFAQVTGGK